MKSLRAVLAALIFFANIGNIFPQIMLNGDFSLGTLFWGCTPEINIETAYGGLLSSNNVCEVDAGANICQTVAGLIPGNKYYLAMDASRRTGACPSPSVTNLNITMSGGVLAATVVRTNTVFGWTTSGFLFTASSIAHTFTLAAGAGFGGSTCGMIVDNVVVVAAILPIELMEFTGNAKDEKVELSWSTATERNNDHFEIERSNNGTDFTKISSMPSKAAGGQSQSQLNYNTVDAAPVAGTTYYRLKQVDFDQMSSYSPIIAINYQKTRKSSFTIYPNPSTGTFNIELLDIEKGAALEVSLYNQVGSPVHVSSFPSGVDNGMLKISPQQQLTPGCYQCCLTTSGMKYFTKVIIE